MSTPIEMKHSIDDVRRALADAVIRSTRRWVPGKENDPLAMRNTRIAFDSSLITPELGVIEVEAHAAVMLNLEVGQHQVWFLTKPATQRVFLDEVSEKFGVAWGPDSATGRYVDLGIRTVDPIDAFLA